MSSRFGAVAPRPFAGEDTGQLLASYAYLFSASAALAYGIASLQTSAAREWMEMMDNLAYDTACAMRNELVRRGLPRTLVTTPDDWRLDSARQRYTLPRDVGDFTFVWVMGATPATTSPTYTIRHYASSQSVGLPRSVLLWRKYDFIPLDVLESEDALREFLFSQTVVEHVADDEEQF